jgi:small subunit ribosomal protein S17
MAEKKKKTERKVAKKEEKKTVGAPKIGTRGRMFEGVVIRKFDKRVTIAFERMVYVKKYERYAKSRTKIHARLPENMDVNLGDLVQVRECRPLSKIIHFIVINKVKDAEEMKK